MLFPNRLVTEATQVLLRVTHSTRVLAEEGVMDSNVDIGNTKYQKTRKQKYNQMDTKFMAYSFR